MKIITWNCNWKFREKFKSIVEENADIYVIQECEDPSQANNEEYLEFAGDNYFWCGNYKDKGLGIFAKEEIKFTMNKMGFKYAPLAPFVHLSAFLFARFNLNKGEVRDYLKNNKLPILLIHGNSDDIVPVTNSRKLKEEFPYIKYFEFEGAPHGISYFVDYEKYAKELDNFLDEINK